MPPSRNKQPRAGLKDTVEYFEAHFGNDPALAKEATRMRAELIMQTHSGSQVRAGKGAPHG